jgi:hypothetical protein
LGVTPGVVVHDAPPGAAVTVYLVTGRSAAVEAAEKATSTELLPGTPLRVAGGFGGSQPGKLNLAILVLHGLVPVVAKYSFVYQNVQSSTGSTCIDE